MLDLINKLYRKDEVTVDLTIVLDKKFDEIESQIDDIYRQIFLDYATWYLDFKENEMAIISRKATDITERRNYIKTRLLGVGTATKEMLENTINSISGVWVTVNFKDMVVTLDFEYAENNKLITFSKEALAEIIPYHLDIDIIFKHILWEEPKKVTWQRMKKYTWGDIKKSVSGTIEKNYNSDF